MKGRRQVAVAAFLAGALALLSAAAPAEQANVYRIRNDTGRPLTCGLRREPNRVIDRFFIAAGGEVVRPAEGGDRRSLICDTRRPSQHFILFPGQHYRLYRFENEERVERITVEE